MPEASDQELIAGCLRGEATAWDLFVERFAKLVHWSIRRSFEYSPPGGREEFCREVFQDFFQQLIDKNELSKLREVRHLRKFLSVMACHLALDRLKSLSRHTKKMRPVEDLPPLEEGVLLVSGESQDPVDWEGILSGSLSGLSPQERACLEFYLVDGKTASEVGQILGIPENTVHSVVRRSKEKLKDKLIEKGYKDF